MTVLDQWPSTRSLSGQTGPPDQWQRAAPVPLALRAAWGTALLAAPGAVLRLFGGTDVGPTPRRVLRVLGARHLAQAGAEWAFGGRARQIGMVVDLLHATTSVGFAVVDRRWRRAALSDTAVTSGFVALGLANR